MVIQAIGLLDELDKELNTWRRRRRRRRVVRLALSELTKIIADNMQYAKAAKLMGDRANAAADGGDVAEDVEQE